MSSRDRTEQVVYIWVARGRLDRPLDWERKPVGRARGKNCGTGGPGASLVERREEVAVKSLYKSGVRIVAFFLFRFEMLLFRAPNWCTFSQP